MFVAGAKSGPSGGDVLSRGTLPRASRPDDLISTRRARTWTLAAGGHVFFRHIQAFNPGR